MNTSSNQTTQHETVRLWIEDRGGVPAAVAATGGAADVGILRVWFPGQGSGDELNKIEWEDFFTKFEEAGLAFVYDIHTADGELSRFCKFVSR